MAWLAADADFNPDQLGLNVIGIASEIARHDSGEHAHKMGQLLFTNSGSIRITLSGQICILPPAHIAWIPPDTTHRAEMSQVTGYRSVYINTVQYPALPKEVKVLQVSALLKEILEKIAFADFDTDWSKRPFLDLFNVGLNEIETAPSVSVILQFPTDRRLRKFLGTELLPHLNVFADLVGLSEKTIGRIFLRETGLNYQQWRQQWRFLKAIELLSKNEKISVISHHLGFSCESAFISFFKRMSGKSPRMLIKKDQS
ncbi:AraC family transcriptional regulator [Acinetobacter bereziniae]|uniref:AraC family transcriptional regulator n=1 Tax=Acinetobacter bereziniae TaxID=106648 RepID=UPI0018FFC84F|nr:helix-turn-helix transcriptional regulator [Acinetobacter bereziniae]MBJ8553741.1 helix-turn-helix transcriptional regulator [Acinetobacter bereziniae]